MGYTYDKETDAIYLRARYYQPYLGKFLTNDTYTGEEDDPLTLHLYIYCVNDGVNAYDPSGHISFKQIWKNAEKGIKKGVKTVKKAVNTGVKTVKKTVKAGVKTAKKGIRYVANKWRYGCAFSLLKVSMF